jgi:hypothetical protein
MKPAFQTYLLAAVLLLSGCATASKLLSFAGNWAVGAYRATARQIQVADQRASAAFARMPATEKKALRDEGVRYLAVRTEDPNPQQMKEIRRNMAAKPSGPYGTPTAAAPKKVYCVMIWDTQTHEVVGTDCYAVVKLPPPGEPARFDTYTAQYVGTF